MLSRREKIHRSKTILSRTATASPAAPPELSSDPWNAVDGWFDFHEIYDDVARQVPSGAVLVEVGCWLGRSIIYLARKIKASGKSVAVYAVDNWQGSTNDGLDAKCREYEATGKPLLQRFLENIADCGVADIIQVVECDSAMAADQFADESVFMVFIDADHRYEAVRADVVAWYPKVVPGGILAGHDYGQPDVRCGVQDGLLIARAKPQLAAVGHSWVHKKSEL